MFTPLSADNFFVGLRLMRKKKKKKSAFIVIIEYSTLIWSYSDLRQLAESVKLILT